MPARLEAGYPAPPLQAFTYDRRPIDLAAYRDKQAVVLVFTRGFS